MKVEDVRRERLGFKPCTFLFLRNSLFNGKNNLQQLISARQIHFSRQIEHSKHLTSLENFRIFKKVQVIWVRSEALQLVPFWDTLKCAVYHSTGTRTMHSFLYLLCATYTSITYLLLLRAKAR